MVALITQRAEPLAAPKLASAQHIVTLAEHLRGGGVERSTLRLASDWIDAGRRVTIIVGSAQGPLAAEVPDGADVIELGRTGVRAFAAVPAVVKALAPDILFCPGNHYTSTAAWTRRQLGADCPLIVYKVSNALARQDMSWPIAAGYRQWLLRHPRFIDHFVAMSETMVDETEQLMRADPARISVIANPAPKSAKLKRWLFGSARSLVGVGRLEPQKRWDRLIDAMPRLADGSATLTIVGEGSERPKLEAQVRALGLEGRVSLPGYVPDPAPLLVSASVAVLTSDFEGVPDVLREALALGTPVVTTESSVAVREIVCSPDLGTVIPVGDENALISALNQWLEPGRPRPDPVPPPGIHAATAYLDLFDRLVSDRLAGFSRLA